MAAPPWLTSRRIAHRGLHQSHRHILENTEAAAEAAIAQGFGIECDLQASTDGEPVVFHDFTLDRLTRSTGALRDASASALRQVRFRGTAGHIPTLAEFLTLIAGRVPLICEIKSRFDGDMRLTDRTADLTQAYDGPVALKSFDPAVIAHLRDRAPKLSLPLGIVAVRAYDDPEWIGLSASAKHALSHFLHYPTTRPDFLSYFVEDLDTAVPFLLRQAAAIPVLAWTVRTKLQEEKARLFADQIIFEGFAPGSA
jgi:glycerophosphoryl diester phosphodiesterase